MNSKKHISFYRVKNSFFDIFSRNKKIIAITLICMVFAIIFAIATIVKNREQIDIFNCLDKNIICFICGDINWFKLFLMYALFDIIAFLIILFCSNSKILTIVNYILIFISTFCCVFNCSLFICLYGIKGLIFSLTSFLVLTIIKLFLFIFAICLLRETICYKNNNQFWIRYAVLVIIAVVIDFIWAIIFKCIFPFFVIIV